MCVNVDQRAIVKQDTVGEALDVESSRSEKKS